MLLAEAFFFQYLKQLQMVVLENLYLFLDLKYLNVKLVAIILLEG